MPSWSPPSQSTFWFTTPGICVPSFCKSQGGPLSGKFFWSQPDLLLDFGQALGIIFHTRLSRTVCTSLVMSKSGGNCSHFPRLSLVYHFNLHFLPFVRCEVVPLCDLVEDLSHQFSRLVVAIFDVFGSYSFAVWRFACFEFADCALWFFWRDFRYSFVITHFMFWVVFFTVFVESFVEFSKGIGNSFSRGDAFTFFVLYFCDEDSLLCCFDSRNISDTFELFKDSFIVLLSFHSFFSDTFFKFLLRSFSRCFSSLGMLLLSSISLRISASLSRHSSFFSAAAGVVSCISLLSFSNTLELPLFCNTIEPASSTWCVICAPRCFSALHSGCSSPSGRCFGSRSPACRSQPLLQPILVSVSCASSSPPVLTSGCGRWFCSLFPAVVSRSLHLFPSSLPRGVDVHPSGRLCSRWAKPHRRSPALLLRVVVLPSVSCATVSTSVLSAFNVVVVFCWLSSLLLRFLLLPSVSCATVSTSMLSATAAAAAFFLSIWSFALFLVSCASISFLAAALFYCDDNILISFLELGVFNIDVFVFLKYPILTIDLRFLSSRLTWVFFSGVLIKKVAIIHLWSLPMWIMSFASASFTLLKYLLLVEM